MNQLSEMIGALELSDVPTYVHDAVLETSARYVDVGPSDSCIPRTIIKGTPSCPRIDDGELETSVSGPRPTSPRYDCTRIDGELETASLHTSVGPTQDLRGCRPRIDDSTLETASLHAVAGPTQSLKGAGGQRC